MPLYIFECTDCDKRFEALMKVDDGIEAAGPCPQCGSTQVQRCMSAPGFYSIKGNNSASTTPKKFRGR